LQRGVFGRQNPEFWFTPGWWTGKELLRMRTGHILVVPESKKQNKNKNKKEISIVVQG